jgi:hypothetical protein
LFVIDLKHQIARFRPVVGGELEAAGFLAYIDLERKER